MAKPQKEQNTQRISAYWNERTTDAIDSIGKEILPYLQEEYRKVSQQSLKHVMNEENLGGDEDLKALQQRKETQDLIADYRDLKLKLEQIRQGSSGDALKISLAQALADIEKLPASMFGTKKAEIRQFLLDRQEYLNQISPKPLPIEEDTGFFRNLLKRFNLVKKTSRYVR